MAKAPTTPSSTDFHLVVIQPFGQYERGARITDPKEIADVLAGENAASVNRVAAQ